MTAGAYAKLFDLCEERGWEVQLFTDRPRAELPDLVVEVHGREDWLPLCDVVATEADDTLELSAERLLRRLRAKAPGPA
jgi:hypothetical protein